MKKKMGIRDCVLIERRGRGVGAFIYYVVLFLPWLRRCRGLWCGATIVEVL